MTQISISQQIDAIKQVAAEVTKTKESALKFLQDAGIIKETPVSDNIAPKKKGK